ncbi:MAG: hypothetical protein ACK445_01410 [Bacteroidota bacterium]
MAESSWPTSDFEKPINKFNNPRKYHDSTFGGFDPYIATDFANNNALLKEIMVEKYISLYGQIEAYSDVRRTNNLIGVKPNTGSNVPQRFLYPQAEINTNPTNTPSKGLFEKLSLWP